MGAGNSKRKGKKGDQVMYDKKFEVDKKVAPEIVKKDSNLSEEQKAPID